jgi:hypothetical protein
LEVSLYVFDTNEKRIVMDLGEVLQKEGHADFNNQTMAIVQPMAHSVPSRFANVDVLEPTPAIQALPEPLTPTATPRTGPCPECNLPLLGILQVPPFCFNFSEYFCLLFSLLA